MLHRGNSNAALRLRRAKSATSVPRRRHPHIATNSDPAAAQKIALTAATLAFERATATTQPESQVNIEKVARSQSGRVSRKSAEGFHLARHQSSRASRKSCQSPTRTTTYQQNVRKANSSCQLTPVSHKASNISDEYPISPVTDSSMRGDYRQFAERFDGYGQRPYTRLRKTQSSYGYTPSQASFEFETPIEHYPHSQRTSQKRIRVLIPSIRENQTDEAIIALARDKYLQDHQNQAMQLKRSFISASLRSRFRKTSPLPLKNSRAEISEPNAKVTQTVQPIQKANKHFIALSFIKKGWRRAFGRSSSTNAEGPMQQAESTKAQSHQSFNFPGETNSNNPSLSEAQTQNWARNRAPTPPPHLEGISRLPSLDDHGSMNHVDIPHYDRSRVTSWNDSTRQSTLVLREINQLPSIQERPDALESPAVAPPPPERAFKVPIRRSSSNFDLKAPQDSRRPLDSRRLISALMRHTKSKSNDPDHQGFHSSAEVSGHDTDYSEQTSTPLALNQTSQIIPRQLSSKSIPKIQPKKTDEHFFSRDNVISPSVYSERFDTENASSIDQSSSPDGTATVIGSRAIRKWHVGGWKTEKGQATSNEWRTWAAEESAGLDKFKEFTLPVFSTRFEQNSVLDGHESVSSLQTSISSDHVPNLVVARKRSGSSYNRQPQFSRKTSLMNDRFPMLGTGRTVSKSSLTSSRQTSNPKNGKSSEKEKVLISDRKESATLLRMPKPPFSHNDSIADKRPTERAQTEVQDGESLTEESHANASSVESRIPRQPSNSPLCGPPVKARTQCTDRGSPLVRRGPNTIDDNFLLRIRKGPYGASSSSLIKVNTSSVDSIRLPKRQSPALSARIKENSPPSQGQKMANGFLSNRANRPLEELSSGSSPAFL